MCVDRTRKTVSVYLKLGSGHGSTPQYLGGCCKGMESSRSAWGTWSNIVLKENTQTTGDIVIILSEKYQMNMSQSRLGIICGRERN